MPDKFQNKYRIPSARFPNWDYRWAGAYFITICTHRREPYFGTIVEGKMHFSGIGVLADVFLYEIQNHTKNVELGEYVVMPNHVHLILILNGNDLHRDGDLSVQTLHVETLHVETLHVETLHATSLPTPTPKNEIMSNISPKSGSVSTIIRSYKSAVSKHAQRLGFAFNWQERFHDHIIRDDAEYHHVVEYIKNNPLKWESDKFYLT